MRRVLAFVAMVTALPCARGETALDAIRQLPGDQVPRLARIEGMEGTPDPDRWYILVQDPKTDNGVREFVVSDGKIVASRSLSQFAESLKPGDVLGTVPAIDSDALAKLAKSYADANGAMVASMNYELKKDGTSPEWKVTCLDDGGNKVGEIVMTGNAVVSHDGFAVAPDVAETGTAHPETQPGVTPEVAMTGTAPPPQDTPAPHKTHHRPSPQPKKQNAIVKAFKNVGHTLENLF